MNDLPLTPEEAAIAERCANLGGRERKLLKFPYGYVLVDDGGGCQFDTLDELKEFIGP